MHSWLKHTYAHSNTSALLRSVCMWQQQQRQRQQQIAWCDSKDGSNGLLVGFGTAVVGSLLPSVCVRFVWVCVCMCMVASESLMWFWFLVCGVSLVGVSKRLTPILFSKPIITSTCCTTALSTCSLAHIDLMTFHAGKTSKQQTKRCSMHCLYLCYFFENIIFQILLTFALYFNFRRNEWNFLIIIPEIDWHAIFSVSWTRLWNFPKNQ